MNTRPPEGASSRDRLAPAALAIRQRLIVQQQAGVAPAAPPPPPPSVATVRPPRRRTTREALLRDGVSLAAISCIAIGLISLGAGCSGLAATVDVQVQTSYLVSGAMVGVALVGLGCGFAVIQADRFVDALENRAWRRLAREWADLALAVRDLNEQLEQTS